MLPGLDGAGVLKQIRAKDTKVPVLILSARDALQDKVANLEAGADDYLTKPFAFAELSVRVKALLRRGPVNRASTVRIRDLELDRLSQQVKRAGKRIELTIKEYSLLEYLMSNVGRVLSRNMIIEHVWDESFDGFTNVVDVYIRHLRKKVDDAHEHKLIHTVRGVGYSVHDGSES
jgi:two-component system copper resistance phosphate regulon response regulator CusR